MPINEGANFIFAMEVLALVEHFQIIKRSQNNVQPEGI